MSAESDLRMLLAQKRPDPEYGVKFQWEADAANLIEEHGAAFAALLDAAQGVMTQMDYETPHHTRLAAALRALTEPLP